MDTDILKQAEDIVDGYLTLLETEVESKAIQRSGKHVCDCVSCSGQRREAQAWLAGFQQQNENPQAA